MRISEVYPKLEEYLLSLKGVETEYDKKACEKKFLLKGKMFCAFCCDDTEQTLITVRCEPEFNELMRSAYSKLIIPGVNMNKAHWSSIIPDLDIPYEVVRKMCYRGYNLIFKSLPEKTQKKIMGK